MLNMIKVNGGYIHYCLRIIQADGPTIVFCNSLGTDFRLWGHALADFEKKYNVLVYDKRGHGLSETRGRESSIADHAEDLIALLGAFSLVRVIPVGLSIGGLIAQEVFRQRPDLISMMILSNTASRVGNYKFWNDRINIIRDQGLTGITPLLISRWFTPSFEKKYNDRFVAAKTMLLQTSEEGYMAACCALRDADLREQARSISVPTLCVAGAHDLATPVKMIQKMANDIPNSEFTVLENVGHIPCLEDEKTFNSKVLSFIRKNL